MALLVLCPIGPLNNVMLVYEAKAVLHQDLYFSRVCAIKGEREREKQISTALTKHQRERDACRIIERARHKEQTGF